MLTDKIDMLKQESCQAEAKLIMYEFRKVLMNHFNVITANSQRLINERWEGNG